MVYGVNLWGNSFRLWGMTKPFSPSVAGWFEVMVSVVIHPSLDGVRRAALA